MTARAPRELDAIADTVLAYRPPASTSPKRPDPKAWELSIERVFDDSGLRLDTARFDPEVDSCVASLRALGHPLRPLGELATLSLPNKFERVWAFDGLLGDGGAP